jgi:hypothetical protein
MSGNKLNNEQKKHISGYTSALSIALIVGLVFESESILAVFAWCFFGGVFVYL